MAKTDDFTLFTKTVIQYLRNNPDKFPTCHELFNRMADESTIDLITIGIGSVCAWHFNRDHTTAYTAADIESCVKEGYSSAALIMMDVDGKVH